MWAIFVFALGVIAGGISMIITSREDPHAQEVEVINSYVDRWLIKYAKGFENLEMSLKVEEMQTDYFTKYQYNDMVNLYKKEVKDY